MLIRHKKYFHIPVLLHVVHHYNSLLLNSSFYISYYILNVVYQMISPNIRCHMDTKENLILHVAVSYPFSCLWLSCFQHSFLVLSQ